MPATRSNKGLLAALAFGILLGSLVAWKFLKRPTDPGLDLVYSQERQLMGTRWNIQLAPTNQLDDLALQNLIEAAFTEVARVESIMSEWQPRSAISAVNAAAGREPVPVPDELRDLIRRAQNISELSEGAFDITWKGLGNLWRLRDEEFSPAGEAQIQQAIARVGYQRITIEENRVGLSDPGMRIGLGGIAKGYGVDRAVQLLRTAGLNNFYIDGGGDIAVAGLKHGRPWRVAIRHPREGPHSFLTVVEISDAAVVTSGDYESFRILNDKRYHHILDPRSGRPADGCQSVTVVAPLAESADALATAAFVLGPKAGLALIASQPGTEALIVDTDGRLHRTAGFPDTPQP